MNRSTTTIWHGTLHEGKGHLTTQSLALNESSYFFVTGFNNSKETSSKELITAIHAGCYAMKLSSDLSAAGFTAEGLANEAKKVVENGEITNSFLQINLNSLELRSHHV